MDKEKILNWLKQMLDFEKNISEDNTIHKKIANRYAYLIKKIEKGNFD